MQSTFLALGCALALAAASAISAPANDSITERAKDAAETIGEKAKEAAGKVKDMAQDAAQKSKAAADRQGIGRSDKGERMQQQADADFKAAKAKCDAVQRPLDRTVCEKQAAVAHANAELRIAKAEAAAQGGKTSAMGAGKSAQ